MHLKDREMCAVWKGGWGEVAQRGAGECKSRCSICDPNTFVVNTATSGRLQTFNERLILLFIINWYQEITYK